MNQVNNERKVYTWILIMIISIKYRRDLNTRQEKIAIRKLVRTEIKLLLLMVIL